MNPPAELPVLIRDELPGDRESMRTVNIAAFWRSCGSGTRGAAASRRAGHRVIGGHGPWPVGHVLFSDLKVTTPGHHLAAAALAPLSVMLAFQNRGVGSQLVRQGMQACRDAGVDIVVVLGDPHYYRRFGFTSELAARLTAPYSGEAFMALIMQEHTVDCDGAVVQYPNAFSRAL